MKKILVNSLLLVISILLIHVSYNVFVSFRYQNIMRLDGMNKTFTLSTEDIQSIPSMPNVSITSVPIKSMLSKYFIQKGDLREGYDLITTSKSLNPYIHYSEFLLGMFHLSTKNIDSALFYSKKAFYSWPRNIEHYKLYNQVLSIKKDTIEIFKAYRYADSLFTVKDEYFDTFLNSYKDAKLGYLIYQYKDSQSISMNKLLGKWQQVYEFEDGNINKLNNFFEIDQDFFYSGLDKARYKYKLENDTLSLYFISNQKKVAQYPVSYSPSYKTLILGDVVRNLNDDDLDQQDQFFKKIE